MYSCRNGKVNLFSRSVIAVDLIQQQTNYINQLNQYMQSKYSFVLQRKILDVLMGVPVRL